MAQLMTELNLLDMETHKHVLQIFDILLNKDIQPNPLAAGLSSKAEFIVDTLLNGNTQHLTPFSGTLLRYLLRHPEMRPAFMKISIWQKLAEMSTDNVFDVSSQAYETLQRIITSKQEEVREEASHLLNSEKEATLDIFYTMCDCENYFAMREGYKILIQILRQDEEYAQWYVQEKPNLVRMIKILNEEQESSMEGVQSEAFEIFHIIICSKFDYNFKVKEVIDKNKDDLIELIQDFDPEKKHSNFSDNKQEILERLDNIE